MVCTLEKTEAHQVDAAHALPRLASPGSSVIAYALQRRHRGLFLKKNLSQSNMTLPSASASLAAAQPAPFLPFFPHPCLA